MQQLGIPMPRAGMASNLQDALNVAADVGYQPSTPIETGVKNFVEWYLEFYRDDIDSTA